MELQTKYITLDDFKAYFGIDLEEELRGGANPSEAALAFLKRVEDRMETYLAANYFKNVDAIYPAFTDYQKAHYKRALLEQAIYVFKNGDISVDSGYDYEHGAIADRDAIIRLSLAENARQELILCGLLNRHIGAAANNGFVPGWFF